MIRSVFVLSTLQNAVARGFFFPIASSLFSLYPYPSLLARTALAMSPASGSRAADTSYMAALSRAVSESLGRPVTLESTSGAGGSGGGGASTSAVRDKETGARYFVKSGGIGAHDMLRAEYLGVRDMAATRTVRVPRPIAFGRHDGGSRPTAFAVFEYLDFVGGGGNAAGKGGRSSQYELGQQLARMHRHTSENGKFGFHVDNTIGATFQPNLPWTDSWADFWDEKRLGHMLALTDNAGFSDADVRRLRQTTREMLDHGPAPSLVHGDLWGGNQGLCRVDDDDDDDGGGTGGVLVKPTIFDPATYYGDREVDIGMTYVFGGFTRDFYDGYDAEWPLPEGHEKRREIYNLYHILNHEVLFGGSYRNQARGMIQKILRYTI